MKDNRIIITGANGFIGSSLMEKMLIDGYQDIIALDIKEAANKPKSIRQIIGDFSDAKLLAEILRTDDITIHLACPTIPSTSEQYLDMDIKTNILGTIKLIQAAVEKKCYKLIFFSSGGTIYGDQGREPIGEDACPQPQNLHGVMKYTIENYLRAFNKLYGLDYLIVRPSNPYGRQTETGKNQGIIDVFIDKIKKNEDLVIWGDGRIVRDYIHIDDLAECVSLLIKKNIRNETVNIGTGIGASVNELLEIIKTVSGKSLSINYEESREFDLKYNVLNIKKAEALTGWRPKINLKNGITKLWTN